MENGMITVSIIEDDQDIRESLALLINGTTFECYRIIRAETEGPEINLS